MSEPNKFTTSKVLELIASEASREIDVSNADLVRIAELRNCIQIRVISYPKTRKQDKIYRENFKEDVTQFSYFGTAHAHLAFSEPESKKIQAGRDWYEAENKCKVTHYAIDDAERRQSLCECLNSAVADLSFTTPEWPPKK